MPKDAPRLKQFGVCFDPDNAAWYESITLHRAYQFNEALRKGRSIMVPEIDLVNACLAAQDDRIKELEEDIACLKETVRLLTQVINLQMKGE